MNTNKTGTVNAQTNRNGESITRQIEGRGHKEGSALTKQQVALDPKDAKVMVDGEPYVDNPVLLDADSGEHTIEVLTELGYDEAAIATLHGEGAVVAPRLSAAAD